MEKSSSTNPSLPAEGGAVRLGVGCPHGYPHWTTTRQQLVIGVLVQRWRSAGWQITRKRGVADQRVAVAADPRAGVSADAADCLAVGSPPVRPRYLYPAAGSAWTAVADGVAADSADPAVFGGAVVGDGRVVAAAVAVAVLDVVVPWKLLPTLPDSAAAAGVDGVRAVGFLEHS